MRSITCSVGFAAFVVFGATYTASASEAAAIAGVYKHLQPPSTQDGATWRDEDILEVVPVPAAGKDRVYFRLVIPFANYHRCDIAGVGTATKTGIDYRKGDCHLTLTFTPQGPVSTDPGSVCRSDVCGARGGLDWTSPIRRSDRRPIRYLDRLTTTEPYLSKTTVP